MARRHCILVVDDDAEALETLTNHLLDEFDVQILTAKNGLEALACLAHQPVNLILTDTNMPIMNGIELLHNSKQLHPKIHVIMLFSGLRGSTVQAADLMRMGAAAVLDKLEIPVRLNPEVRRKLGV